MTYRPKGTRSPLGGTDPPPPLKDIPLKFQKSLALEKYSTFKFSNLL